MIGFTVTNGENQKVIRVRSLYKRCERMTARLKAKEMTGSDGLSYYHFEIVWKKRESDCPKSKVINSCVGKSFAPAVLKPIDFAQLFVDIVGAMGDGSTVDMRFNDNTLGNAVNILCKKLSINTAEFPQRGDFTQITKYDIWK